MTLRSNKFKFLAAKHDGGDWRITSPFGNRILGAITHFHNGIDIGTYTHTKVYAPYDGVITANRLANDTSNPNGFVGAGFMVALRHDNGDVVRFLHLLEASPTIKEGQRVKTGQLICQTGQSGASYSIDANGKKRKAAHLHLDIAVNGQYVDPLPYLSERGLIREL